jgi:hypothetical protein
MEPNLEQPFEPIRYVKCTKQDECEHWDCEHREPHVDEDCDRFLDYPEEGCPFKDNECEEVEG